MNENERDLLKRLAPKPVPPPPQDLLRKLKEEIPERLPANVRPFRRRVPVQVLRIAAMLFVAGGALFVVTKGIRHRDLEPGAPLPAVSAVVDERQKPAAEPAPAPPASEEADALKKQKAPATRAQGFAPEMPPAEKKTLQAPARPAPAPPPQAEIPKLSEASRDEQKSDGERERRVAENAPAMTSAAPQAPAGPEPAGAAKAESALPRARKDAAANRVDGYLAADSARQEPAGVPVHPTSGSLLGQVLGRRVPAAAAREGGRFLVLLCVEGETGQLSGAGRVLSAAALPGGGLVVLAEAREGAPVALRSGEESASAGVSAAASAEVHLAWLAWRLESARASGDEALRASVAREAERLAPSDPRAAVLRDLSRAP